MNVIVRGKGKSPKFKFNFTFPDAYEVVVTRSDGLSPAESEILSALKFVVESMKPKRKPRIKGMPKVPEIA